MLALPLSPSATSVAANLRLSEAVLLLVPASGLTDESAHAQTLDLLRNAPKPADGPQAAVLGRLITSYERTRLLTLERKLILLADLRAMFPADAPVASQLDHEIEDQTRERAAIEALHDAFFRGRVIVLGVRKGSSQSHQRIQPTFFSQPRALIWRSNEIRNSESVVAQTRATQGEEYTDVLVEGSSFERWRTSHALPGSITAPTLASASQSAQPAPQHREAAYREYVAVHARDLVPPNRNTEHDHMRSLFPNIKREELRKLRAKHAPSEWTKKGRRQKPRTEAAFPKK